MDAENYSGYPDSQFEEDNVLRELNKCLLAFRQNTTCPILSKAAQRTNIRINSIDSCNETESVKEKERNAQRRYIHSLNVRTLAAFRIHIVTCTVYCTESVECKRAQAFSFHALINEKKCCAIYKV